MTDILPLLAKIVEENTRQYQTDFLHDKRRLEDASWNPDQEFRTFLWMSRPCGTWCVLEREAFLLETPAHIIWTGGDYIAEADQIKAYRVIVAPERTKGSVLGKIQPLLYGEQVQRVKQNSLHVQTVNMKFEDGAHYTLSYEDYQRQIYGLINTHGRIERIRYAPEDERELSCILTAERAISAAKKRPPRKKKPATR